VRTGIEIVSPTTPVIVERVDLTQSEEIVAVAGADMRGRRSRSSVAVSTTGWNGMD
jgi:hypothetical protein